MKAEDQWFLLKCWLMTPLLLMLTVIANVSKLPIITGAMAAWTVVALIGGGLMTYMVIADNKDKKKDEPTKQDRYCRDCGAQYTEFTKQRGFDPKTGQPHLLKQMACPSWQVNPPPINTVAYVRWTEPTFGRETPYNCGNTTMTNAKINTDHNGHPAGEVDFTCYGCIDDMQSLGVIDAKKAKRMKAIA